MIGFCPLASGSKGNATFVGTKNTRVLIDAGISVASLTEKLGQIGIELATIEAILVTHEHTDHIAGLAQLAKVYKIPVLANAETAKGIYDACKVRMPFKIFTTGESFVFGDLEVHPFSVPHDTLDPVGFTVKAGGVKVGFCTDLGYATSMVKKQLEGCDYLVLEANHQPSMVHASNRPAQLKERILGRQGHLSNQQCVELLNVVYHAKLRHVHLAHLSGECNSEELALQVVKEGLQVHGRSVDLSIAHQDKVSRCILF